MISDAQIQRLTQRYDFANIPWYLSYPAITRWKTSVTEAEVHDVLKKELNESKVPAYLYFHWPYCETLCYYCTCYMQVTNDPASRYDEYLASVERELELKIDRNYSGKVRAGQMHWGGGTPTYMSAKQIERAFKAIDKRVSWMPGAVLSVEAYPDARTLSVEKVKMLKDLGFNQLSFGIESLDPKVLEAINRKHELSSIRQWVDVARSHELGVHVDLVYGLPYQTVQSLRDTVKAVLSLKPSRVATYSFSYTPLTVKHQRVIPRESIPSAVERFRQFEAIGEVAAEEGYVRVGTDHWVHGDKDPLAQAAKRGEVIHHFMGYEPLDRETWLGFGASAISFAQGRYFKNLGGVADYNKAIAAGKLPVISDQSTVLNTDDRVRHQLIQKHVLADLKVDKDQMEKRFSINFDEYFKDALERLDIMEADGLVKGVRTRTMSVTPVGLAFVRNVANAFDRYLPVKVPPLESR